MAADTGIDTGSDEKYGKTLTVIAEIEGGEDITAMDFLRKTKEVCGRVVGCRMKSDRIYEVTMGTAEAKRKMIDGFKIKGNNVIAKELNNNELVVSFLNLPVYTTDEAIRAKLAGWGVRAISPIKRRFWPGTDVADGTRYLKVKFTDKITSLPYSAKFDSAEGAEYYRVIHDRQVKVCRLCIQPGHILRDCPDFICFRCHTQGHYARECNGERGGGEDRERDSQEGEKQEDKEHGQEECGCDEARMEKSSTENGGTEEVLQEEQKEDTAKDTRKDAVEDGGEKPAAAEGTDNQRDKKDRSGVKKDDEQTKLARAGKVGERDVCSKQVEEEEMEAEGQMGEKRKAETLRNGESDEETRKKV